MKRAMVPRPPDLSLVARVAGSDPAAIPSLVRTLADEHGTWRGACLDLVASHNHLSPGAQALLSSSAAVHTQSGSVGSRNHAGGAWIDAIDTLVLELCKRVFGVACAEFRPTSGSQANWLALAALTRPGDTVFALPVQRGGHRVFREDGFPKNLGLRVQDIPCDDEADAIDLDRLEGLARRARPTLIIVGTAPRIFPVRALRTIADAVGARLFYDGAQLLGLIAGGQFQDPLKEGATVMAGATQKTLGGPIGGLILTNDEDIGTDISRLTSGYVFNSHNNRVAALAVTLAETAQFGREYAAQVVRNARALASHMIREGLPLLGRERGGADFHAMSLDTTRMSVGGSAFRRLEEARILSTRVALPATHPERLGIRMGTAAATRMGMAEEAMAEIAALVRRVATGEPPANVATDATELAGSYRTVRYCFQVGPPSREGRARK